MTDRDQRDAANGNGALLPPISDTRRSRSWKWLKILGLLVVVAAVVVILEKTVLAPEPPVVSVAEVSRGVVEETVTNTRAGTVEVRRRASLSPQIGGRVVYLPVEKGDRVVRGQVLLQLDDSVQRAQVRLARENVKTAEASADEACLGATLAAKEFTRQKGLYKEGIASEEVLDRAETEKDRSEAACRAGKASSDQARAQQHLAEEQLAQTRLEAPFDGVIAELSTEVGEWIMPSPPGMPIPPVIDLINPGSIYVSAPIDEMDAERVRVGQEVRLSVDSRRGQSFPGRLVRVAPYVLDVVEQNRTIEIDAEFNDAGVSSTMLPGTSADIEVILERKEDVLNVPSTAVAEGHEVLVVNKDGVIEARTVEVGLSNWRNTEIVSGLDAGETVVTLKQSEKVVPGAKVEVKAP